MVRAPAPTKASAIAKPIPRPPPVTTATRLSSRYRSLLGDVNRATLRWNQVYGVDADLVGGVELSVGLLSLRHGARRRPVAIHGGNELVVIRILDRVGVLERL